MSINNFSNRHEIRDYVGNRIVDGYRVSEYYTKDDEGHTHTESDFYTKQWYSKFAINIFELFVIILCLVIPYITWGVSTEAIKLYKHDHFSN